MPKNIDTLKFDTENIVNDGTDTISTLECRISSKRIIKKYIFNNFKYSMTHKHI